MDREQNLEGGAVNLIAEMLGTRYPVIQGAMGVICNPEMVAAVSRAGGFGVLGSAFQEDAEELRRQIEQVRTLTDKPFGANLTVLNPRCAEMAQVMVEMGLKAITTSAGNPGPLVEQLKPHGVKVLHVCPSVDKAVKAQAAGVDAVIAEGGESGGIQGPDAVSTMVLVPAVADAVDLPVVAAGGIADSRGYRAALALGAQGVQVGTRFIASTECIAHQSYKQGICRAGEGDTFLVQRTGRILVRVLPTDLALRIRRDAGGELAASIPRQNIGRAWLHGDLDAYTLAAGQVAGLVREVKTVREIIEEMVSPGEA
ncbi:MAG: nitronate monooxygenase [Desulfarculaceae bacterium]|nr:nitronate monooxygenase [Desulfarculaceae bacterium]MCF8047785.1 nitronate monooxygenase [Desulfarculaceae bacterium]MCF8065319.1 nitronate monooxygenase [Desulfarculaceae bacterium]MCF8098770.1 nitronate monooxygenase [Desulfarculaceae bacterium]MCF8122101.1 nitronate monooxygenase [Desulfarculaceae bacterium]